MEVNDWIKEVKTEDIPNIYRDIAVALGTEALLKLAFLIGGTTTYIPKIDFFIQAARDRLIIREYNNGAKPKDLAIKYDLTDVWVRKIIDQYLVERDQLKLFEKEISD